MVSRNRVLRNALLLIVMLLATGLLAQVLFPAESSAAAPAISRKSIDSLTTIGKAMAEISAAVKPAIVNISTTRTVKVPGNDPFAEDPFFRHFFGDNLRRQPKEQKSAALGSGVIVSSDGYIITNYHVVKDADEIKVLLADKREFSGKVIGSDPKTEISVVKIDAKDLPTLPWGNSDSLEAGDLVLAVGNPYGLNQTVTMGIVSAVGRANVGIADYEDFIQTDAPINPGNSGGALVNVRGQLIGINTAIFSTSGGYQGIGFAIPSNMVRTIMESLVKEGKVIRGWLGISIQRITPDLAKQFNLKDENGVLVSDVTENGPAEKAGLKRGDVILEYDGKKTDEPGLFRNMVANTVPGEEHSLKVLRDGKVVTLKVTIGELPPEVQQAENGAYQNALRGIGVQDITPDIAKRLGLPPKVKGVIVNNVDEDSPAYGVLAQGDVIQEIDRKKITNVKDYQQIVPTIGRDSNVLLLVYRRGSSLFITLSSQK
ncbi:MAG: DegQ family serine endoprotease [Nitrospiraceae bacterium]|nr:DegQ family serine endoprotease [Nitrospiraceae bacterium]